VKLHRPSIEIIESWRVISNVFPQPRSTATTKIGNATNPVGEPFRRRILLAVQFAPKLMVSLYLSLSCICLFLPRRLVALLPWTCAAFPCVKIGLLSLAVSQPNCVLVDAVASAKSVAIFAPGQTSVITTFHCSPLRKAALSKLSTKHGPVLHSGFFRP